LQQKRDGSSFTADVSRARALAWSTGKSFIVGTHQSEIRDILISVFTDVATLVICDSLHCHDYAEEGKLV